MCDLWKRGTTHDASTTDVPKQTVRRSSRNWYRPGTSEIDGEEKMWNRPRSSALPRWSVCCLASLYTSRGDKRFAPLSRAGGEDHKRDHTGARYTRKHQARSIWAMDGVLRGLSRVQELGERGEKGKKKSRRDDRSPPTMRLFSTSSIAEGSYSPARMCHRITRGPNAMAMGRLEVRDSVIGGWTSLRGSPALHLDAKKGLTSSERGRRPK